jgi:hypothetical protein
MGPTEGAGGSKPRTRIWVQHVAVETNKLQMRVNAARARGDLSEPQEIVAVGIDGFIHTARAAAFRDDPVPGRLANWWRGTLVEAAYRNMHTARTALIDLYTYDELQAEIPMVVARANATLHRDDPRRMTVAEMRAVPEARLRPRMRRLVGDSYEQLDQEHAQLRSFRNILLMAAAFLVLAVAVTLFFVTRNPGWIPLCFDSSSTSVSCPTTSGTTAKPTWSDILVVTGLGALGGAFAATLAIRNLKGTSTPYDVPVALAALKVPLGALTAILGLVAIKGGFAPGLSNLDNQGQILAYTLLFGFSQQALSRLLDKRAQDLLEGLPGGEAVAPLPGSKGESTSPPGPRPPEGQPTTTPGASSEPAVIEDTGVAAAAPGAPDIADAGGGAAGTSKDRPVEEPEGATQQDQFDQLRDTGNARRDMTEEEEADLLQAEFGAPNASGIYGAPAGGPSPSGAVPPSGEPAAPEPGAPSDKPAGDHAAGNEEKD